MIGFGIVGAHVEPYAAVPTLVFDLTVEGGDIESIALRCQVRIEPHRRRYTPDEERKLVELFGETPRWGDTLKPFLWTHVATVVPGFRGRTQVELSVPCTYDLDVAAAKYFHALEGSDIPLIFLFSGSVFARADGGALRVTQIPWDREIAYRLPVRLWRELMDAYFPGSGWMRLRHDTLDALLAFKARRALPTWDEVMAALLETSR
jgi:Family of unknown function (DUF6084)